MAYDAGYNAVIPYENVTAEDSKTLVLDALLSRGPKGAKNTVFMIGGKNAEKAEQVFEAVKNAMFPPFKGNIIVDPAGAYTTAAAMVAKAENALSGISLGPEGQNMRDHGNRSSWTNRSRTQARWAAS
jgi:methylene-tetrahydromethanopterin dehydrogenase